MNESAALNTLDFNLACQICLYVGDNTVVMTDKEYILYRKFVLKSENISSTKRLCVYCKHMLTKMSKFIQQCQEADYILQLVNNESFRPLHPIHLKNCHNLVYTETKCEDFIDDHCNEAQTDECNSIFITGDMELTDNGDDFDDDEIPLKLLKTECVKEEINDIKETISLISNSDNASSKLKLKNRNFKRMSAKKTKRELREGFSSRMVQETDEYIVIKLTKEQVHKEMEEQSSSEKYKRSLFKCEKCVKGFNFEDVLKTHMEKHSTKRGLFQCEICTQYCPSKVSLRGHLKSHTTRYKCKICGQVRLSRQHLREHYALMHAPSHAAYSCAHCNFTSDKRTVMQRHVRRHKTNEKLACELCGKLFKHVETLRVHTARHDTSKFLQCSQCSCKFIYASLLQKHILSVHERRDYYCVECDVGFSSHEGLKLHFQKTKRHRDYSSFKHQCPHCENRFITAARLSSHLSAVHGAPKQHNCTECGKLYSSREALRGHVRRSRCGWKADGSYECNDCGRSFTQSSLLKRHLRTHCRTAEELPDAKTTLDKNEK